MRANVFKSAALAAALAVIAVHQAAAQVQQPRSDSPPTPVHVTVPPGGLTFNFGDIDRNGDKSISVEEWNAFVASLQSRVGGTGTGSAAAGATGAGKPAQSIPQR